MTTQEAIESLKSEVKLARYIDSDYADCVKVDAICVAVEALKKQIPKKKHKYMGYRCVCGNEVSKNQDYCEFCGQRLEPFEETRHDM